MSVTDLPALNATLNGISFLFLVAGYVFIRRGQWRRHRACMIGALVMATLRNGSNQMGWPNYMQEIIIGAVIILAVGLDRWRQSRSRA